MPDEVPQSNDFWNELDEAEQSVEKWPPWQQRYEADVYYDRDDAEGRAQSAEGRSEAR
jgi:hypothetical protein